MGDVAYINKSLVSWSDLKWIVSLPDLGGAQSRFYGFKSLDFGGQKRERPPQYGQNRAQAPLGLAKGKYTPPNPKVAFHAHALDADQTAPFDSFLEFVRRGAPDGNSYGDVRMNWLLQVDNPGVFTEYNWYDVYIVGDSGSWEESPEGLIREVEFTCTRFKTNGATLYDSSEE